MRLKKKKKACHMMPGEEHALTTRERRVGLSLQLTLGAFSRQSDICGLCPRLCTLRPPPPPPSCAQRRRDKEDGKNSGSYADLSKPGREIDLSDPRKRPYEDAPVGDVAFRGEHEGQNEQANACHESHRAPFASIADTEILYARGTQGARPVEKRSHSRPSSEYAHGKDYEHNLQGFIVTAPIVTSIAVALKKVKSIIQRQRNACEENEAQNPLVGNVSSLIVIGWCREDGNELPENSRVECSGSVETNASQQSARAIPRHRLVDAVADAGQKDDSPNGKGNTRGLGLYRVECITDATTNAELHGNESGTNL